MREEGREAVDLGMKFYRQGLQDGLDVAGQGGACVQLSREASHLLSGGDLPCQQQPVQALRQGLLSTGSAGQQLLALRDGEVPEADTLS